VLRMRRRKERQQFGEAWAKAVPRCGFGSGSDGSGSGAERGRVGGGGACGAGATKNGATLQH
jgi:hypothetical protein